MEARLMEIADAFPHTHSAVLFIAKSVDIVMQSDVILLRMISQVSCATSIPKDWHIRFNKTTDSLLRHCVYIIGLTARVRDFIGPKPRLRSASPKSILFNKDMDGLRMYALARNKWWAARRIAANAYLDTPRQSLHALLCCVDEEAFTSAFAQILAPV
jgi:hypothetical protein